MSVGTVLSAGSSLAGAGASLLGGSNASDAAESAQEDTSQTTAMDKLALMIGFNNAYKDTGTNTTNALAALAQGANAISGYGQSAQNALSSANGYWDNAYDQGSGDLNNALAMWDKTYNQIRSDESNYMALGQQGLAGYSGLLTNPSSVTSDPGYQFGLNQGVNALDRSAASKGLLLSGSQQKALDQYGQDYGQTYLDKILSRYDNAIDVGQTATTQVNNAGLTSAQGKSSIYNSLANLAATTASGKSGLSQASANAYLNTGTALNTNATSQSSDYNTLSTLINSLWNNTASNLVNLDTSQNQTDASTASAEASSENNALSGLVNSLNGGVKNYLTSSGYGTSGSSSLAKDYTFGGNYYGSTPW